MVRPYSSEDGHLHHEYKAQDYDEHIKETAATYGMIHPQTYSWSVIIIRKDLTVKSVATELIPFTVL